MGKAQPILRDAETKDMKSIMFLMDRLIEHEVSLSDLPIIEDVEARKSIVMEMLARALVSSDQHVWVVDKSGRILGVFIAGKQEIPFTIQERNPVCVFSHGYNQKTVLSFFEIHNRVKEWAKEKGCKSIYMTALAGNTKVQRLFESLGYSKMSVAYEMEV